MKREKKQQGATSGEKGAPRSETIHPFLLLEEENKAGSQKCTMGVLMYIQQLEMKGNRQRVRFSLNNTE